MASAAATVPAESDLLCESCGYILTGLPEGARCPECGVPTADSAPARRGLPAWERPGLSVGNFCASTLEVIFRPSRFYRKLATRASRGKSRAFAAVHILFASLLFGITGFVHARYFDDFRDYRLMQTVIDSALLGPLVFSAMSFLLLALTVPIAARLTSWEARYRGLRLPLPVVLRGLDYHTAHYLPVAAVAAITVIGYRWLSDHGRSTSMSDTIYIYSLCGEVVLGAFYLFWTYWIGMRKMMYANA